MKRVLILLILLLSTGCTSVAQAPLYYRVPQRLDNRQESRTRVEDEHYKDEALAISYEYDVLAEDIYEYLFGSNNPVVKYSELDILAKIISAEARGESFLGQLAVGNVVLNRVFAPWYPNSIEGVIFQSGQFCPIENKSFYEMPTQSGVDAAMMLLRGYRVISQDVIFFYNPDKVSSTNWIRSREVVYKIGNHSFAR